MNIEDFNFSVNQIVPGLIECLLVNKQDNSKFGIIIKANGIPPNNWIFDRFLEDKKLKNFFVDIQSEIVYDVKSEQNQVVSEEKKEF